jgi:hypothetical protein
MEVRRILVFDPTPQKKAKGPVSRKHTLDLEGRRMAVVWNRKLGGDILLERFTELLMKRLGIASVERVDERGDSGRNLDEDVINRLASTCDAAIVGTGD